MKYMGLTIHVLLNRPCGCQAYTLDVSVVFSLLSSIKRNTSAMVKKEQQIAVVTCHSFRFEHVDLNSLVFANVFV